MPPRLSYEPSVEDVFRRVLPPGSSVSGESGGLRRRVSWPVTLRARGIGEVAGGEILLVPAVRAGWLAGRGEDLANAGVGAMVIEAADDQDIDLSFPIPTAVVPSGSDLRALRDDMERYIIRRRRDLFALEQELHRLLVEAALGGRGLETLLTLASRRSGRPVVIERDGETVGSGASHALAPLEQVRAQPIDGFEATVWLPGPPPSLALEVPGGRRRNVLLLVGEGPDKDEDEALITTLASASAIVLAREPDVGARELEQVLEGLSVDRRQQSWAALALSASPVPPARQERAVASEAEARGLASHLARDGEVLIALLPEPNSAAAAGLARSLVAQLGAPDARIGLSRRLEGPEAARRAALQASRALERAGSGEIVEYDAIEVEALLAGIEEWEPFVVARLGPILGGQRSKRELVSTLRAYLKAGKNTSEAARDLGIHRNTLIYRLSRIQDLLGIDLDDPDATFALQLALRLLHLRGAYPTDQ